jgi:rare lipoprotein A
LRITSRLARGLALAAVAALAGCKFGQPASNPSPHYVVGDPYQAGGVWRYPRAEYGVDISGLATFEPSRTGLTADGEVSDQNALAAAHPTLQLPAVLRVTNLENGRQILVRLNDRGPDNPARLISLSRHAAELLQMTHDATRVRVQMDDALTRQLVAGVEGGAPKLDIQAAPEGQVSSEQLAPPTGVAQAGGRIAPTGPGVASSGNASLAPAPVVLRDEYWQVLPHPGMLYIDVGYFSRIDYASILVNRLAYLGAKLTTSYTAPRDKAYRIQIGPLFTLQDAEAMLARTIAAGVNDAAIVVE